MANFLHRHISETVLASPQANVSDIASAAISSFALPRDIRELAHDGGNSPAPIISVDKQENEVRAAGPYESKFEAAVQTLKDEGRYRMFANIERKAGAYPLATHHTADGVAREVSLHVMYVSGWKCGDKAFARFSKHAHIVKSNTQIFSLTVNMHRVCDM